MVQQGNVQQLLQVLQVVSTNVRIRTFRGEQVVTFFPNTYGVRLDSRQVFHIANAKKLFYIVHFFNRIVKQIYNFNNTNALTNS